MKLGWIVLRCLATLPALAVIVRAQQAQPQQAPTFKSGTQVVEVDVRVFDKDGHFVTNLDAEDFEIKENGVVQPIGELTLIGGLSTEHGPEHRTEHGTEHPAPSTQHRAPAPSTEHPAPGTGHEAPSTPSIWLFVFDTLHLSDAGLHNTRKAVVDFLQNKFHDGDIGGVVVDGRMANNRLTSVRGELVKAVDAIRVADSTFQYQTTMHREWPPIQDEFEAWRIAVQNDSSALQQAVSRACAADSDLCRAASPEGAVRSKAQNIMTQAHASTLISVRVVEALSNGLARMAGPKTVVYISDGFVIQGAEEFIRDATGMANRAGAHFYTIDARGLNKGSSSDLIDRKSAFDSAGAFGGFDMQADGTNALAVDTGGVPIRNENNFGRALDQIQQDASTYYVIGYTPSNQTFDGKYRKIDVSVNRAGVHVRARRGYLALEPAKLLKPVAITPAVPAPAPAPVSPSAIAPEDAAASTNPTVSAPAVAVLAASPENTAAEAAAVRTRIDKGGLVAALRGDDRAPMDDPASLGWAAYQKGDVESAERELTKAAADPAAHPWVHYVLGLCRLALNEYPSAAQSWERVRSSAPSFEPVYFDLADAYSLQNDRGTALSVLDAAAKRWPKDAEIFDAKGVIQIHARSLADAIASFERATKLAPKDPLGFFNLASAHHAAALRLRELSRSRTAQLKETQEDRRLVRGGGFVSGAVSERDAAIKNYRRVIALKGLYVEDAKKGLKALSAK